MASKPHSTEDSTVDAAGGAGAAAGELEVDVVEMSFAQERFWLLDRMQPGSAAYNVPLALSLSGPLRQDHWASALDVLARRHESLRTTFEVDDDEPLQVISPAVPARLEVVDLTGSEEGVANDTAAVAHAAALRSARLPFDLERGPLWRACLWRLSDREHLFVLTMHHIVTDGWSLGVLLRELLEVYRALGERRPPALPELSVQYADYSAWQREWLSEDVLAAEMDFWRGQLTGMPTGLEPPTDRPRGDGLGSGAAFTFHFGDDLPGRLRQLARGADATLFMTLLAAYQTLLSRFTGERDVVVGVPVANRQRPEVEHVVGCFVNTVLLRGDLSGDPGFDELLRRVRRVTVDAFAHAELPFERLVEELEPDRRADGGSLFQVVFAMHQALETGDTGTGLELTPVELHTATAKFELNLQIFAGDDGISGFVEYDTGLFDGTTVRRWAAGLEALLEDAAARPGTPLSRLAVLTPPQLHQVLVELPDRDADYPRDASLQALFAASAARHASAVAVDFDGRLLTYAELDQRASRLARRLRALGAVGETRVGLCLERSVEMVVAVLAVIKAGAAYLPLDTAYPEERIRFMIDDGGASILLTQETLAPRLAGLSDLSLRLLLLDTDWPEIERESADDPAVVTPAEGLAYIMYTSGSTGRPKGVPVTHRAISRLVLGTDYVDLGPADVVAQASSSSFDAATFEIWGALLNGARLFGVSRDLVLSPDEFAVTLAERRVSILYLTSVLLSQMADRAPDAFGGLRTLMSGGEVVDPVAVRRVLAAAPPERLLNIYGPTEITTFSSWYRVERLAPDALLVPIGRAIANTTQMVVDATLEPVPPGVHGELYLGGPGLARGYHARPALTAVTFVPDSWGRSPGERCYRTGDRVRRRGDGGIEFLGRMDRQVKIRGFRIEPGEVEAWVRREPQVRTAAVMVRQLASGETGLVAYVVPEGGALDRDAWRGFLRDNLPDYMVPPAVVELAALPHTPNGKVDLAALPDPAAAPAKAGDSSAAPRSHHLSPFGGTPTEEMLASVWAEGLGVETIGSGDNFFDLGGTSLKATTLTSHVRSVFRITLPIRTVFEAPTLAGLAERIDTLRRAEEGLVLPPLEVVPREGDLPLSFAQQRLWFLDHLELAGTPFYNVPVAIRLAGTLDAAALERVLGELMRRHEGLRTTFESTGEGRVTQVFAAPASFPLPVVDLGGLGEARRRAETLLLSRREAHRTFDLSRGPLMRATLLRLGDVEHVLQWTLHHIVTDGWSMEILTRELTVLYEAFAAGRPSPLPAPRLQYADFAVWQRRWLTEGVLESQLAYWAERLAGAPTVLTLPHDRPRPALQTFRGARQPLCLDSETAGALKRLGRRRNATAFMSLLALFELLLHRLSGQSTILVGSPIANRNRSEVEDLVGCLVNMLVLRGDFAAGMGFERLLDQVRESSLDAYAHQDLPFERLVEELQPQRDLSHNPLFQVSLTLQTAPLSALSFHGVRVGFLDLDWKMELFDLTLELADTEAGWSGHLIYNTDLFDASTARRMAGYLEQLTGAVAARPAASLESLDLLGSAQRQQLLLEWNAASEPCRAFLSIGEEIDARAAATPAAPAVVAGEERLSYGELAEQVSRLARHLRRHGVGRESLVGVCMERAPRTVAALLAVWKAGGAFVPLDPAAPAERLTLQLAGARLVLVDATSSLVLPGLEILRLDELPAGDPAAGDPAAEDPAAGGALPPAPDPRQLAYVVYTSGSTGRPKGVAVSHGAAAAHVRTVRRRFGLTPEDRVLQFTSLAFDVALEQILPPLAAGACLVPRGAETWTAANLVQRLTGWGVTVADLPTAYWHQVLRELDERGAAFDPPALRLLSVGSEAMPPAAVTLWRRVARPAPSGGIGGGIGGGSTGIRLVNAYGPTEATMTATVHEVEAERAGRESSSAASSVAIGRPLAGRAARVLDAAGRPAPPGTPGELHLGGCLARGYLGRPAATAASFVPDPFGRLAGERLYRTGDRVVQRAGGSLLFLGRTDHQVKIRGLRVEPDEVRAVLEEHPEIRQAAVVAVASPAAAGGDVGDGEARLVAFVVAAASAMPEAEVLRQLLRRRLPEGMVPQAFVPTDELPLTPGGKVDRGALVERARSDTAAVSTGSGSETPANPMEDLLLDIWSEVLDVEQVGRHDNFFDLGGHSLLLTLVQARLQETFDRDLSMVEMFNHPTIDDLGRLLTEEIGVGAVAAMLSPKSPEEASAPPPAEPEPESAPVSREASPPREASPALRDVPHAATVRDSDIAVIGMVARLPGAEDTEQLWSHLADGVESISFFDDAELAAAGVPAEHLAAPNYVRARGRVDGVDLFDAGFFEVSPLEARIMDPQHRLFLECAWQALEDAGYAADSHPFPVGVFGGASKHAYLVQFYASTDADDELGAALVGLGNDKDYLTTRVSYKLNLEGPSVDVQTACSTSLVAVHLACQSLLTGDSDLCLAGGVSVHPYSTSGYFYQEEGILSPDGHCRAFDERAAGTLDSDGVAMVVLKRLADALADGDTVRAVIKASGINNDGSDKVGFSAPRVASQARLIRRVQERAGVPARSIRFMEAHGTATPLGDPIEVAALTEAFRASTDDVGFCALGSLKSNLGHTGSAAGVAGLVKTVLALEHRQIPPSLHCERPNPELELEASPFFVNRETLPWAAGDTPRRAAVSSLGVGGTNAHAVVEEAPAAAPSSAARPWQLLTLSAKTASALETATRNLARRLCRHDDLELADIAWTLQRGRRRFDHRRTVLCRDLEGALAALEGDSTADGRFGSVLESARNRGVVFLFPGQGSQRIDMGRQLYADEEVFRRELDRCAELLEPHLDADLLEVLYPTGASKAPSGGIGGGNTALDRTALSQPALFAVEYALARTWISWGVRPQAMLGHSIGEYVAACLAGVFSLEQGLGLVATRGRLMDALPPGAMLAVSLAADELEPVLGGELSLAVIDGPRRSVVAGPETAVETLRKQLLGRGVDSRRLAVSHAFHSPMMEPVLADFERAVSEVDLEPPKIPFLSNLTGTWIRDEEATRPGYWADHLRQPVRLADGLAELLQGAERCLLEVGPGRGLSSRARRLAGGRAAARSFAVLAGDGRRSGEDEAMAHALAGLWRAGAAVDWEAYHAGERRRRVPLPTYPFEGRRYWLEPRAEGGDAALLGAAGAASSWSVPVSGPAAEASATPSASSPVAPRETGAAGHPRPELETPYVAPRNDLEKSIAAIWQESLGLDRVGVEDSFMELGGDSLLAAGVLTRVRHEHGVELPLTRFFEAASVTRLARTVADARLQAPAEKVAAITPGTEGRL